MNNINYQELYAGSFHDNHIVRLAKEYHDNTNSYDRSVCTGEGNYPANARERHLINSFAKNELKRLATENHISCQILLKEIQRYRND